MVGSQAYYHNYGFSVTLFNEQKDTEAKLRLGEGTLQALSHLNDVFGRQGARVSADILLVACSAWGPWTHGR